MTCRYARAGWSGSERPCSQSRSVPSGILYRAANSSCVKRSARRNVLMRGTRLALARSSSVNGRASGSAHAAASTSSSVIGVGGGIGISSSVPSGLTRTSTPSRRILAIVVVLLTFGRLSSRNDADAVFPFRVDDREKLALAHSDKDKPLLAICLARIGRFNPERIVDRQRGFLKTHAMRAEVLGRLIVVQFKPVTVHQVRITSTHFKAPASLSAALSKAIVVPVLSRQVVLLLLGCCHLIRRDLNRGAEWPPIPNIQALILNWLPRLSPAMSRITAWRLSRSPS